MIRTFLAVNLPPDEHQIVIKFSSELQQLPDAHLIRWVVPDALHITLAFLGDIQDDRSVVVSAAISDLIARRGIITCSFEGLRAFPAWPRFRVLGIGVSDPSTLLNRLQADITSALRSSGFEVEDRPYIPHLTLGRVKKASPMDRVKRLAETLMAYEAMLDDSWLVQEVKLIHSQLGSGPPRYSILDHYPLGG